MAAFFGDDCLHLRPFAFHIGDQLELGPAAVQVVARPVDGEVMVAVQVVGQEPDAAFQRHQLGAQGQDLLFQLRQPRAGAQKAPGIGAEQVQAHLHLAQIGFILGSGGGTEADGIAKVIAAQARHNGVQVDDAQRCAVRRVQHDVVELRIVMGDPQGELPRLEKIGQGCGFFFPVEGEADLVPNILGPAHGVGGQNLPEDPVTVRRVVEVGDYLVQAPRGEILELLLEAAKGRGALVEIPWALRRLQAQAVLHKFVHPPEAAVAVG